MELRDNIENFRTLRSGKVPKKGSQLFLSRTPACLTLQVEATKETRKIVLLFDESRFSTVDIHLEENALLELYLLQSSSSALSLKVHQQRASRSHIFLAQSASAKTDIEVELLEPGSEHVSEGFFLTSHQETSSVNLSVRHMASDTTSSTLLRGVSTDCSSARFHGLVFVKEGTCGVDASQLSQNIALDEAHIVSEPQLEIYADDVKCSHGSTVGNLPEDALGYLRQRGIGLLLARNMLIEGFLRDTLKNYSISILREENETLISEKLKLSDDVQR